MTTPLRSPRPVVDQLHPAAATLPDVDRGRRTRRRRQVAATAGAVAVAALLAAGFAAASGGEDSLRAAPSHGGGADQQPVEGGPAVADGTDLGHLQSITDGSDGAVLVLDRVEWLDHDDLVARHQEQGLDPAEALDFEVVDEQQDLHRYPVSDDVEVTVTIGLAPPDLQGGSVPSSLAELRSLLQDPAVGSAHLFDVTVQDGVVVRIDHRYVS